MDNASRLTGTAILRLEALDYEIRASWWASHISNRFLQNYIGLYFAWKVARKFRRYQDSIAWEARLRPMRCQRSNEETQENSHG